MADEHPHYEARFAALERSLNRIENGVFVRQDVFATVLSSIKQDEADLRDLIRSVSVEMVNDRRAREEERRQAAIHEAARREGDEKERKAFRRTLLVGMAVAGFSGLFALGAALISLVAS